MDSEAKGERQKQGCGGPWPRVSCKSRGWNWIQLLLPRLIPACHPHSLEDSFSALPSPCTGQTFKTLPSQSEPASNGPLLAH